MEEIMNDETKGAVIGLILVAAYVIGSLAVSVGMIVLTIYLVKWILL